MTETWRVLMYMKDRAIPILKLTNYVDGLISFASTVIFLFTLDISG